MFWRIETLSGRRIEDLPYDVTLRAHRNLSKRYAQKANDYNHSAAILVAQNATPPGEQFNVPAARWMPYKLTEDSAWFTREFCDGLLAWAESSAAESRVRTVVDLENSGILPRIRKSK